MKTVYSSKPYSVKHPRYPTAPLRLKVEWGADAPKGSSVTPSQNRAYSFDRTRLALYVFLDGIFVWKCSSMQLAVALGTENECFSAPCRHLYLSMILGANFSSESGPEILLNRSLLLKFGGHVTTKKGATWLFDNEKGNHLWHVCTHPCSNGVAQTVPEAFLFLTMQSFSTCLLSVQRLPPPATAFPTPGAGCSSKATPCQGRAGGARVGWGRARLGLDRCGTLEQPHGRLLPTARSWH